MRYPAAIQANQKRASLPLVCYRAFREMKIPLWKVLPGLMTQFDKMYAVAQFGAATEAIQAATVHGDLDEKGVQFIGQCQGLISDIPSVEDLVQDIIKEASFITNETALKFGDGIEKDKRKTSTLDVDVDVDVDELVRA